MANDSLTPWHPDVFLESKRVEFEGILYSLGRVGIHLSDLSEGGRKIILMFDPAPVAIRIANESFRLSSLKRVPLPGAHSFYLDMHSDFLAWLNSESSDIYRNDPIKHFVIISEEWIDILCSDYPEIIME